jgi:hypothetical protein
MSICGLQDTDSRILESTPMEFYSAMKKNEYVICRKMDGTGDYHIKNNKLHSERQISHFLLYAESRFFSFFIHLFICVYIVWAISPCPVHCSDKCLSSA